MTGKTIEIPKTSKAVVLHTYGGPETLSYETIDTPTLLPTVDDFSVIVKIEAAGVNPVDYKLARGDIAAVKALKFPAILGIDYAGKVVAVGPKVVGIDVGEEVYGKTATPDGKGAYAEYLKVSVKTDLVVKRPAHLSAVQAAGVGVVALTAYVGIVTYGGLSATDLDANAKKNVLIVGASGGVGSWGVLIAKKLGAKVTAIASGKNKDFVLHTLKADRFIDYTSAPLEQQLTVENEFDVVLDGVGGDGYWQLCQKILKPAGLFSTAVGPTEHGGKVTIGAVAGMVGGLLWKGVTSSRKYRFISGLPVADFRQLEQWFQEKGAFPAIPTTTLALQDAGKAHELSASHRTVGKIVLLA
ncbi:hypothetical protein HDU97_008949 [Phlyctochytrium planicorne]|nr:hypothetical protein HDU97_008949 [Phlyctochytrium planicorne]